MTILKLDDIYKAGAFAGEPVEKEIEFTALNGEAVTGTVWVKRLSYKSAVGDIRAMQSDGEIAAGRIANCIVNQQGEPLYKVSDVTGEYEDGSPVLDGEGKPRGGFVESLVHALWRAIAEVNDLGKTEPPQS